jgi:hypothetical protein
MSRGGRREGAGRPKGVPNKDNAAIRDMIIGALNQVGGMDYLAARALDTPAAFMTLIGKVLPTQLVGDPNAPIQYVIRGPTPVESTTEWLRIYAPKTVDVETEC